MTSQDKSGIWASLGGAGYGGRNPRYPIRVLIVDDHAGYRRGLRAMLDLEPDMEPVGEAGDGREAAEMVERSEEHTSELQSQSNLVCRLLLEKKKDIRK